LKNAVFKHNDTLLPHKEDKGVRFGFRASEKDFNLAARETSILSYSVLASEG
jgi:hypothetical protein